MGWSLPEMIAALDALLAALHADGGAKAVVAVGPGTRVDPTVGHSRYRFVTTKGTIPDDTPVEVKVDGTSLRGVVVSYLDGRLIVDMEKNRLS